MLRVQGSAVGLLIRVAGALRIACTLAVAVWVPAEAATLRLSSPLAQQATAPEERVLHQLRAGQPLRVCIWTGYYGITWRNPRNQQLVGLDIDLSRLFAEQLGVPMVYVESSFGTLIDDLLGERCDLAMFAIGVLPQRARHLAFSQPYLRSGIYAVTTRSSRIVRRWADIDRPGVVVAVQAGTFMEPVMGETLKQAQLRVIRPPMSRERELEAGRVDVFMTDYPYSRRLLDNADWARLIEPPEPFHVLPYAYAMQPGQPGWLAEVDAFVLRIRQDGRLLSLARRHGLAPIVVGP